MVADVTPAEAVVWDIDLQHAVDYDNIIPNLKSAGKIVIVEAGKPVFQIEYPTSVRDDMDIDQADYDHFCVDKNGNEGFSEVLKHASEQVDGWGQFCGLGRTGGRFETPIVERMR
ncbi:hypothetical protein CDEST_03319 [Colletotrichum destructivum]|uniref:Uncharacterized protein n=1 Tax=Colletotrichum destructivum TaxID=34406 RepID=A0AAX4I4U5_9PEZI|nr:hypothetical protein CDEST_03319 [Colletotrichum destructivum]